MISFGQILIILLIILLLFDNFKNLSKGVKENVRFLTKHYSKKKDRQH